MIGQGGTVILTELAEILGAETQLKTRSANAAIAADLGEVLASYKAEFMRHGQTPPDQANSGNLAGGVTTLEEKAIGALQKAGQGTLNAVLRYGQRAERTGFNLLEAPATDEISTPALAVAGANLVLFSTGRGTPLGSPVPTLKIASNTELAREKPHWIDFDAGPLALGTGVEEMLRHLLTLIVETASGKCCAAELAGHHEAAFWKRGVSL